MRFLADRRQHFFPADRRKSHFFGSTAASTLLCANPYCIPALRACIPTMFKHFLACISIISKLCVRARSCCIPAPPHAEPCWNQVGIMRIMRAFLCISIVYFYCISIVFCLLSSSVSALLFLLRMSIAFLLHLHCISCVY